MAYDTSQFCLAKQKFQSVAAITPASLGEKAVAGGLVYMDDGLKITLGEIIAALEQINQKLTTLQNTLSSTRR
jgi:hypothetical protein